MARFNPFETEEPQKSAAEREREQRRQMQLLERERAREYRARGIETDRDVAGRVFPVQSERNRSLGIEGMVPDERGMIDWQNTRKQLETDIFSRPPQRDSEIDREISELRTRRTGIGQFIAGREKQLEQFDKEQGFQFKKVPGGEEGEVEDVSETGLRVRRLAEQKGETLGFFGGIFRPGKQGDPTPEAIAARQKLDSDPELKRYRLALEKRGRMLAEIERARQAYAEAEIRLGELQGKKHVPEFFDESPEHDFDDPLSDPQPEIAPSPVPEEAPAPEPVRAPYEGGAIVREGDITAPLPQGYRREAEPAEVAGFIQIRDVPLTDADRAKQGTAAVDGRPYSPEQGFLADSAQTQGDTPEPFTDPQQTQAPEIPDTDPYAAKAAADEQRMFPADPAASEQDQQNEEAPELSEPEAPTDREAQFDESGVMLRSGYVRGKKGEDLLFIDDDGRIYPSGDADPREAAARMVELGVSRGDAEKILTEAGWIKTGKTGDFQKDFRKPTVQDRMNRTLKEDERPGAPSIPPLRTGMESREIEPEPIGSRWNPEFQKTFESERERIQEKLRKEVGNTQSEGFWAKFSESGWDASFGNLIDLAMRGISKAEDLEVPFGNPDNLTPAQIREKATMMAHLSLAQELVGLRSVDREAPEGFKEKLGTAAGFMAGLMVDPVFRSASAALRGPRAVSVALPARSLASSAGRGAVAGAKAGAAFAATHPPVVWMPEKGEFSEAWANQAVHDIAGFAAFGAGGALVARMASPLFWKSVNLKPAEGSAELTRIGQKYKAGHKLTPEEAKLMEQFIGEVRARAQKGDFSRFDPEFQVWRPREWVEQVPFLNDLVRTEVGIRAHERGRLGEGSPRLTEPRPAEPAAGSRSGSRKPGETPSKPQPKTAAERVEEGFDQPKPETPAPKAPKPTAPTSPKAEAPKPEAAPKPKTPVRAPGIRSPKPPVEEPVAEPAVSSPLGDRVGTMVRERLTDLPEMVVRRSEKGVLMAVEQAKYNDFMHPKNAETRAIFEELTGVKLPKTAKETREFFDARKGEAFPLVETVVPASTDEERGVFTAERKRIEALSEEEFEKEYREAFEAMNRYTPDQVGSRMWAERMATMEEIRPEWVEKIEAKSDPKPEEILIQKWKEQGVEVKLADKGDVFSFDLVKVPEDRRRQGIGSQVVEDVKALADEQGKPVELVVVNQRDWLPDFYRTRGFSEFTRINPKTGKPYKSDAVAMRYTPASAEGKAVEQVSAESGETGRSPVVPTTDSTVRQPAITDTIRESLLKGEPVPRKRLTELAKEAGVEAKEADELAELGVVQAAREIAQGAGTRPEKFDRLVQLYENQPNLTAKTSTSKINQAYSTPAPLAYLMSELADIPGAKIRVSERTAGNGMLLIGADPAKVSANEIDPTRLRNLQSQGFAEITQIDASTEGGPEFDRMSINPPFGSVKEADGSSRRFTISFPDGRTLETTAIDHAIALKALESMTPDGKAAIMIGGHKGDPDTRVNKYNSRQNREFFYFLHENYNVVDHFTIDGDLYAKQGAGWPVDIIVIDGKGKSGLPLPAVRLPQVLSTWSDVRSKLPAEGAKAAPKNAPETLRPGGERSGEGSRPSSRPATSEQPRGPQPERVSGEPRTSDGGGSDAVSGGDRPAKPADGRGSGVEGGAAKPRGEAGGGAGTVSKPAAERRRPVKAEKVGDFQSTYTPASKGNSGGTITPSNLAGAQSKALDSLHDRVGSIDAYVKEKLGYKSDKELHKAFFAEQVDALALAIDSIESGRGFIVGDQTGVGKGRIAAGLIRYAVRNGMNPVFVTAKKDLYNDMLRDLAGIGNKDDVVPYFTDNNFNFKDGLDRQWKTGNQSDAHLKVIDDGTLPGSANVIFTTYSQIGSDVPEGFKEDKKTKARRQRAGVARPDGLRMQMLRRMAPNSIFILDESHKGAGDGSEVNLRLLELLQQAKGAYYSSATYAKNPDAIPLYFKTSISDAGLTPKDLVDVMGQGGVPLQQFVSNMLAQDGQYLRRERSYEGIDFREIVATENEGRDRELADRYTDFMNQLVFFWRKIDDMVKVMDKEAKKTAQQITGRKADGAVESMNFGSSLFAFTQQYLFALKADSIVKEAIKEHKAGRKIVIAVQNTNEGPINDIANLGADLNFNGMLLKTLENILWVRKKMPGMESERIRIEPATLPDGGAMFSELQEAIKEADFGGMPLSPIDYIRQQLEKAGIPTGEITGRKTGINADGELYNRPASEVKSAGKIEAMRQFNNGGIDALIINSSGSTGFSLHAAKEYKDQRQRVMIVGQAQLDINEFMQTLGRIHRAGQVVNPVFRILSTALPAEKRLSSMLRRKMAMLNANTTSNADTDISAQSESTDIFNKYGDEVMLNVLRSLPGTVELMPTLFPNGAADLESVYESTEADGDFVRKVTGHLVLTPIADQELVWKNAIEDYTAHINYLNEIGENDLIVQPQDYQAETLESKPIFAAGDGKTAFSSPANLETVKVESSRKPLEIDAVNKKADGNRQKVAADFAKYKTAMQEAMASEVARRKEKSREWTREKEDAIRTAFNQAFSSVAAMHRLFGRPVQVGSSADSRVLGVVTDIKFDLDHPRAISKQMVEVHVNTSKQRLWVPISKSGDIQGYEGYAGSFAQDWEATKETSSIKRIVTGNLLAGYKFLKDQNQSGKMITYTTKDGEVTQGIELPANASIGEMNAVKSADELWDIITANNRVFSAEGLEFVLNARAEIELRVPSSKLRGGKFWQNPALNKMLRGGEFREIGGLMRGTLPREKLPDAFRFITSDLGQQLVYTPKKPKGGAQGAPVIRDHTGSASGMGAGRTGVKTPPKHERIPIAPIYGGKPKPKDEILLDFAKATKVKIRTAKTAPSLIGTFFPSSLRTVIRYHGDLDAGAHEVAHNLDSRFGIVSEWAEAASSPFDGELAPFWEHGSIRKTGPRSEIAYMRAEGVAEWIRAYIVNPVEAAKQAPRFYEYFLRSLPADMLRALDAYSRDVREWAGLPANERTLQNIRFDLNPGSTVERLRRYFRESGDEFSTTWLDELHAATIDSMSPVWKAMEHAMKVRGITHLMPEENPKILARLMGGLTRKTMDVFEHGPITAKGQRVEGFPNGFASLFAPLDKSSMAALEKDVRDGIGLMVNQRIMEKARQVDKEFADRVRQVEIKRLEAERAKGDLSPEAFKERVEELRAAETIREMVDLLDQEFWEPKLPRIEAAADRKKSRIAGTGGGVFKDHEQAAEALKELQVNPERLDRLKKFADLYRKWSDSNLRYLVDKGRMSEAQYKEIVDNNEYYVAMQRIQEDVYDNWTQGLNGRKLARARKVIHKFKGSTRTIKNPLVNLMEQTALIIREADRNEVMMRLRDLLTAPRGMYEGVALNLDAIGSKAMKGDPNTVRIFVKGKEEFWQFEKGVARALNDWFEPYLPSLIEKAAQIMPRVMHEAIVHSPGFIVRSTIKDPLQAAVVSRAGRKPWDTFHWMTPGGIKEYREWLSRFNRAGGGFFGHHKKDSVDHWKELVRIMKKETGHRNPAYVFTSPLKIFRAWHELAANAEIMGRLTEFRKAVAYARDKLGYDEYNAELWAAFQARDLTDYAVAGRVTRGLNRYLIFTSAAVRGLARSVEGAMASGGDGSGSLPPGLPPGKGGPGSPEDGKGKRIARATAGMMARWLAFVGTISAATWIWNQMMGDEEEYLQQPEYLRDYFWLFRAGDDRWIAIPKPWEQGVAASGIERGLSFAAGNEDAFDGFAGSMVRIMAPVDEQALMGPFKVFGEIMANRDLFRDRMIVPPWEENLDLDLRKGTKYASRLGQAIQSLVGIDARNVDHFLGGQFGDFGRFAMDVSDAGRDDRRGMQGIVRRMTGIVRGSPAWNSVDVQWVMAYAERRGLTRSREIRELRDLLSRYFDAETPKARDEAAKRARDYATRLRERYERDSERENRIRFNPFNED